MGKIENISRFIDKLVSVNELHWKAIIKFLNENEELALNYIKINHEHRDPGFNLLLIASDFYYRENLHSDILFAILNPDIDTQRRYSTHDEGLEFLNLFIQTINKFGQHIDLNHYKNARVEREKHRIDLTIRDDLSKRAIIIENKINNALDMDNQIPRYYKKLVSEKYTVDCIVYLSLDGISPDKDTWHCSPKIKDEIKSKLLCMPADKGNGLSLHGFLEECINYAKNENSLSALRQYSKLIKYLGGETMNYLEMERFYDYVTEGANNFKIATQISEMVNNLPAFRMEKIIKSFEGKSYPFQSVEKMDDEWVYFSAFPQLDRNFKIAIYVGDDSYHFNFYDEGFSSNRYTAKLPILRQVIKKLGYTLELNFNDDPEDYGYYKVFQFPSEEKELYKFVESFIAACKKQIK